VLGSIEHGVTRDSSGRSASKGRWEPAGHRLGSLAPIKDSAPGSVGPARRREVGEGRGDASGSDLETQRLNTVEPNAVDPIGQGESMPARPERVKEGIAPGQAGFGDSRVVLADRMDQADVCERRSSNRTSHGYGHEEGDWVLVIGRTMTATAGAEGESWT